MQTLEDQIKKPVPWVAAIHTDHTPLPHVHILAVISGKLERQDLQLLTRAATQASLEQRRQRAQVLEHRQQEQEQQGREEDQWDLQR